MFANKSISRIASVLLILASMLALTFSALDLTPAQAAGIRYAMPGGTGDCSSWANACTLQTALTGAASGDEIWAAAGTHKPTTIDTDRSATFQHSGVAIYGGFAGTETTRDQRDPAANVTILSGDIDNNDSQAPVITDLATVTGNTTNSYHVVTGANSMTLDGLTITAGNANGEDTYTNGSGGGMYSDASGPMTLTDVTFSGNSAAFNGGGMYSGTFANPTLTDVTFSGNMATGDGGGMYNWDNIPALTDVTFSGNMATGDGGGMYNLSSWDIPTLEGVTFISNTATTNGGGMYNGFSNPMLTDVTFIGNSATTKNGGGMYNSASNPTLTNVTFSGNTAILNGNGGGGMDNHYSSPTLTNVIFSDNSAEVGGGISNMYNSSPTLMNVTFTHNSAGSGGGMSSMLGCNPTLTNVTFSGNTATADDGGGMIILSSGATLTNVTFSGNSAASKGGGIYITAMYTDDYSLTIRNTLLWGNTAVTGDAQIYHNNYISPVVSDSVVQDGYAGGTNIITTDPLLGVLGDYGGFAQTIPLLANSSAIDTGNDATCATTDQRGVARPQGAHCDIGAFEWVMPLPVTSAIYLPLIRK